MVVVGKVAYVIVRCPVCQCEIVCNGVTQSHATYAECLDALNTELFVIVKKLREVTRLNIKKSEQLQNEIDRMYDGKLEV